MLELLRFTNLGRIPEVEHFVSTRRGGVSTGPFASLNLSFTVGDSQTNVEENRRRLAKALGNKLSDLIFPLRQLHGVGVWQVRQAGEPAPKADILVTQRPDIMLCVLSADCVPVLLYDPVKRVVAAVHAGRKGLLAGVIPAAVTYLKTHFDTEQKNLIAGLGPAIAAAHYDLAPIDVALVRQTFSQADQLLRPTRQGCATFDLWGAAEQQLLEVGVRQNSIEVMRHDTYVDPEHFFSARREKPFGCIATGIMLR
ncbi:MAG: peptidoglycan editing factor PgeF [Parcubacteria group bacterium]